MAKGCGACGKYHGYSMLECIQREAPVPTVERIPRRELPPAPSTVHKDVGTVSTVQVEPTSAVHQPSGTVPKNRAWEQRNSDSYRAWRREYDRARRSR